MSEFDINPQEEVMNPETDCPVCYMNMEQRCVGENCQHILCEPCFQRIINTTNKCPICREEFITHNIDNDDNEELLLNHQFLETIDYDELIPGQRDVIFEGEDVEPTDNLFNGRKWFDVTTQQLKIWINGDFREEAHIIDTFEYNVGEMNVETRIVSRDYGDFNTNNKCPFCGIQRTKESNKYLLQSIIRIIPTNEFIHIDINMGIININSQYCWGTNAFDGQGLNCCLSCWIRTY